MKNVVIVNLLAILVLASCGQAGFKDGKSGLKYKIVAGNSKDSLLKKGDIVQFSQIVKIGDSVLQNSYEAGNQFMKVDSLDQPLTITEVLKKMRVTDSAFIKLSVDSIYGIQYEMAKKQGASKEQFESQIPAFLKKKNSFVTFGIKVIKKYTVDSLAMLDFKADEGKRQAYQAKMQQKMQDEQKKKDEVGFKDSKTAFDKVVAAKGSTWKKTPSGAMLEILTEGTGDACTPGKQADVRYIGKLMSNGTIFDTNVKGARASDTTTKPTLPVVIGQGGVIKGFDEGLAMLKKGSKANIYIPAELGYGGQAQGADLPAYSNLVFEVTIEDVKAAPPAPKPQAQPKLTPEQQAAMMKEMQKQKQ